MLEVAGFLSLAVSNGMKAAVPAIPSRVPAWRALLNKTENYLFAMALQTTIYRHFGGHDLSFHGDLASICDAGIVRPYDAGRRPLGAWSAARHYVASNHGSIIDRAVQPIETRPFRARAPSEQPTPCAFNARLIQPLSDLRLRA